MDYGQTVGRRVNALRRERGMTQEQLAERLGVSYQAVSKWANGQACPDIALLPVLAGVFGVTVDNLFGLEPQESAGAGVPARDGPFWRDELPWQDDGKLRAVLFFGRRMVLEDMPANQEAGKAREIRFVYDGPALEIESQFSVTCGEVQGSVSAGRDVKCGDVGGKVTAGGGVICVDVGGKVTAGGGVTCADVGGNVSAGREVDAADIEGDVTAGTSVVCADVGGSVWAQTVQCGDVAGTVGGEYPACAGE